MVKFCLLPQSGTNQQFGEPGVWPGHVKEWWRRWRCSRRRSRRRGPLPRPQPCQSIAGQARSPKARHRGGVPGTPVLQPHPQGCGCVLRRCLNIVTLCAVPISRPQPSQTPSIFYIKQDHYQSLLHHPIFKICCFLALKIPSPDLSPPPILLQKIFTSPLRMTGLFIKKKKRKARCLFCTSVKEEFVFILG